MNLFRLGHVCLLTSISSEVYEHLWVRLKYSARNPDRLVRLCHVARISSEDYEYKVYEYGLKILIEILSGYLI